MNTNQKAHSARPVAIVLVLLLLFSMVQLSFAQTGTWVAASGTMDVYVADAQVIDTCGMEGDCTIEGVGSQSITITLGTLTMPGAYAQLQVTVANAGNLAAYLKSVDTVDTGVDCIVVSFPEISTQNETVTQDESCTFTMVVSWREDCTDTAHWEQNLPFSMTLLYENDELVFVPDVQQEDPNAESDTDNETDAETETETETAAETETSAETSATSPVSSVQTGDDSNPFLWYVLSMLSALGLLWLLRKSVAERQND